MRRIPAPGRWPLRVQSAVAAALVVGLALLVGGSALLWLLRGSLTNGIDAAATARAGDVADQLTRNHVASLTAEEFAADGQITVVQVLDPRWQVLRSTLRSWSTPVVDRDDVDSEKRRSVTGVESARPGVDLRVATIRTHGPDGEVTVVAGASREPVEAAEHAVAGLLALGGPVIVIIAAGATYLLVGRSLRSVEAIRSQVAELEASDLSQRVPVPRTGDEVDRLATTMNAMLARLEDAQIAQRRFVGDASHELRSPLATLTAALDLARDRPETLDRRMLTDTLLPETDRMGRLVRDMLTLARADEHSLVPRAADVDLDDLALDAARAVQVRGTAVGTGAVEPARVLGDAEQLGRVVRNLVDNAAAHAGSRVTVASGVAGSLAWLRVDDDGPGVPAGDRERVFQRFVRLEADRSRSSGGTGLGLAIAAEIVAAHEGTVRVEDSPLGGARFVVELPAAPE
ncbi:HAMP domain-containing sensor histidine kinase [Tsukamurella sp. 8F]|uniref:sensor histidine kinase n=1 Tax=Tsukamurella sp. 8F TaxID=3031961 RepID=UPI0023B96751|nr:HAMP domain-containing sensor histidine kinase [Tsukamurella sp. 8F]MDF0586110.1 HAMP domain-containing sensor histidine kinase [Tsukamurella sp. 8F]